MYIWQVSLKTKSGRISGRFLFNLAGSPELNLMDLLNPESSHLNYNWQVSLKTKSDRSQSKSVPFGYLIGIIAIDFLYDAILHKYCNFAFL